MILHSVQVYFFSYQRVVPLRKKNPFHTLSQAQKLKLFSLLIPTFPAFVLPRIHQFQLAWHAGTLVGCHFASTVFDPSAPLFLRNCDSLKVTLLHHCAYQPHLLPH